MCETVFDVWVEVGGQLTGGGRFARIDVADNDHVDVHLFLTRKRRVVSILFMRMCDSVVMMLPPNGR